MGQIDCSDQDSVEPKLLVIDVSASGGTHATGQLSNVFFGGWSPDNIMHLHWSGIRPESWPWKLTTNGHTELLLLPDLVEMCLNFKPDVIYYRPVNYPMSLHEIACYLIRRCAVPYVIHIMDDWPARMEIKEPLFFPAMDLSLRELIRNAAACLSISQEMSVAFEARYGRTFLPFANVSHAHGKQEEHLSHPLPEKQTFVFRYFGSLANDMTRKSLVQIAEVIEKLECPISVLLEVYINPVFERAATESLSRLKKVRIFQARFDEPYEAYIDTLRSADGLIISYNWDEESYKYTRYSLANKLPEYLSSGVPIFAYGPPTSATIASLKRNCCAMIVDNENIEQLKESILRFVIDEGLRNQLTNNATRFANTIPNLAEMRNRVQAMLAQVAKAESSSPGIVSRLPKIGSDFYDLTSHDLTDMLIEVLHLRKEDQNLNWLNFEFEDNDPEIEFQRLQQWIAIRSDGPEMINQILGIPIDEAHQRSVSCNFHRICSWLHRKGMKVYVFTESNCTDWSFLGNYPLLLPDPLSKGYIVTQKI